MWCDAADGVGRRGACRQPGRRGRRRAPLRRRSRPRHLAVRGVCSRRADSTRRCLPSDGSFGRVWGRPRRARVRTGARGVPARRPRHRRRVAASGRAPAAGGGVVVGGAERCPPGRWGVPHGSCRGWRVHALCHLFQLAVDAARAAGSGELLLSHKLVRRRRGRVGRAPRPRRPGCLTPAAGRHRPRQGRRLPQEHTVGLRLSVGRRVAALHAAARAGARLPRPPAALLRARPSRNGRPRPRAGHSGARARRSAAADGHASCAGPARPDRLPRLGGGGGGDPAAWGTAFVRTDPAKRDSLTPVRPPRPAADCIRRLCAS